MGRIPEYIYTIKIKSKLGKVPKYLLSKAAGYFKLYKDRKIQQIRDQIMVTFVGMVRSFNLISNHRVKLGIWALTPTFIANSCMIQVDH